MFVYLGPIRLGNGPHVLVNGPHVLSNGPHVLGNEKVECKILLGLCLVFYLGRMVMGCMC